MRLELDEVAILADKAGGVEPVWRKTGLASASRAALTGSDLYFHDLQYEGANRLLEAGWPIHHGKHMSGYARLDQASTYLNATEVSSPGEYASQRRRIAMTLKSRCRQDFETTLDCALPRTPETQEQFVG